MKYYLKVESQVIPDILDRDIEHFFVVDKILSNDILYTPWIEVNQSIYNLATTMLDPASDAMTTPNAHIELDMKNNVPIGLSMVIIGENWTSEEEKELFKQRVIEHEAMLREKGEL